MARGATSVVLLLLAALVSGGCGNLTAGGARGDVDAAVSGDASESGQQASSTASPEATTRRFSELFAPSEGSVISAADEPLRSAPGAALIEGDVDATLRVYLENDVGQRFAVVGTDTRAVVDVQGNSVVEMGGVEMDVGSYPRARIVFTDVHAVIESGLIIGGQTLDGRIDVGDETVDSIVVEEDVGIDLEDNAKHQLLVDLNSPSWLILADPVLKIVAPEDFASAVKVRVR